MTIPKAKAPKSIWFVVPVVSGGALRGPYEVEQQCVAPDYCVQYSLIQTPHASARKVKLKGKR